MMKYLKYSLLLAEPVRISDDSSAKQGQTTTRRYIPGSTIRGFIVNKLASEEYFPDIKKELFSDHVRFQNAYPSLTTDGEERLLLPSPKGFYEDKRVVDGEKEVQNVVVGGEYDEALKRAKLGAFVLIEQSDSESGESARRMSSYTPAIGSDTKIKLGMGKDQEVFRSTAIQAGYRYTGYIALDHAEDQFGSAQVSLAKIVSSALNGEAVLGNARTAGYGKCVFENSILTEEMPYASLAMQSDPSDRSDENECYMMLLSDTAMRDDQGEYCGLHLATLEKALGVKDLRILYCATSVTDIRGFNRHYGGATPSVTMYEKGSVFHFAYHGSIDREHLDAVHREGIGIRRNEGYGQVLFIDAYEDIRYKMKGTGDLKAFSVASTANKMVRYKHDEDPAVIKNVAKAYCVNLIEAAMREYVVNNPLKEKYTASQLGNVMSIAIRNRFSSEEGWKSIDEYYSHKIEKEQSLRVHSGNKNASSDPMYRNVISVIKTKRLTELLNLQLSGPNKNLIMGIPLEELLSEQEIMRIRLELLIQLIRYDFKKEVKA